MKSLRSCTVRSDVLWILVDEDSPSLETQCLALGEALDFPAQLYRVSLPSFWQSLPLWTGFAIEKKICASPKPLTPPWPSFVVCGGKVASKMGVFLRKKHGTFAVAMGRASSTFHKRILQGCVQEEKGRKIITFGPLHRIHPDILLEARKIFYRHIDHLPKPRVGLFLEGKEPLEPLIKIITALYEKNPFSLMIHGGVLRRESINRLKSAFQHIPHVLWKDQEEDPYLGFLAHSEAILLSHPSPLLLAEAGAAGKPLFIYPASNLAPYAQALTDRGYAKNLTKESSVFSRQSLPPLQEAQRVAKILKKAYEETYQR